MGGNGQDDVAARPNPYLPQAVFVDDRRERYLYLVRTFGPLMGQNARAVGVSRRTVNRHLQEDPEFKAAFEEAKRLYLDELERTIHRRGSLGWDEPVFYKGEQVGTVRKFDSSLLVLEAKRHMPEYREKLQVDADVRMGVLVVGSMATSEEWEGHFGGTPIEPAAAPAGPSREKGNGREDDGPTFRVGRS